MKIKVTSLLLAVLLLAGTLCSCNLLGGEVDPDSTVRYENEEYHFYLYRPAVFSTVNIIPSEDNDDEITIELIASDDNKIEVFVIYNPEDDLYSYAESVGLVKSKISALTSNSFVYDRRECALNEKPAYYIMAATKRMIYVVRYQYEHGDTTAQNRCDNIKFEFEFYANLPKKNAFLSSPYNIAGGTLSVCVPANLELTFYPYDEQSESTDSGTQTGDTQTENAQTTDAQTGEPDYTGYDKLVAKGEYILGAFASYPSSPHYTYDEIISGTLDTVGADLVYEITESLLGNVDFYGEAQYRNSGNIRYSIREFNCEYGNKAAFGSIIIGYGSDNGYFEYVYAITDDASEGEMTNYNDMLNSIKV